MKYAPLNVISLLMGVIGIALMISTVSYLPYFLTDQMWKRGVVVLIIFIIWMKLTDLLIQQWQQKHP